MAHHRRERQTPGLRRRCWSRLVAPFVAATPKRAFAGCAGAHRVAAPRPSRGLERGAGSGPRRAIPAGAPSRAAQARRSVGRVPRTPRPFTVALLVAAALAHAALWALPTGVGAA